MWSMFADSSENRCARGRVGSAFSEPDVLEAHPRGHFRLEFTPWCGEETARRAVRFKSTKRNSFVRVGMVLFA